MSGSKRILDGADWKRNFRVGDAEMLLNPNIRIGCSGWQYTHWRGDFYPAELAPGAWLDYYVRWFNTVEINNTFYRLPLASTFASWARRAPRGFVYAVKASRYLTHMKKLKDPRDPVRLFFTRAKRLGRAFGPVLYQLPPRWPVNVDRLETFLRGLPQARRHAIQFREPTWYCDEVFVLLERHKVSLCLHDMGGSESERRAIGPFVYVRFHGVQKYGGRYSDRTIEDWADWLGARACEGRPIYAYFNNDVGRHPPPHPLRLRAALAARVGQGREGQE